MILMENREFLDALDGVIDALIKLRETVKIENEDESETIQLKQEILPPIPQHLSQGDAVCSNCGANLLPGLKFCKQCGTPVQATASQPASDNGARICLNCGEKIDPWNKFCKNCGTPV